MIDWKIKELKNLLIGLLGFIWIIKWVAQLLKNKKHELLIVADFVCNWHTIQKWLVLSRILSFWKFSVNVLIRWQFFSFKNLDLYLVLGRHAGFKVLLSHLC